MAVGIKLWCLVGSQKLSNIDCRYQRFVRDGHAFFMSYHS